MFQSESLGVVADVKPNGRKRRRVRTRKVHKVRKRATVYLANCARVLTRKARRAKRRGKPCDHIFASADRLNRRANCLRDRFHVEISAWTSD